MLQITVTVCANEKKVMEEARKLELEGIVKLHDQTPTLTVNVPDRQNEEMVIATLARLARKGFVTEFKSKWIK
jgi:hypothetical protein